MAANTNEGLVSGFSSLVLMGEGGAANTFFLYHELDGWSFGVPPTTSPTNLHHQPQATKKVSLAQEGSSTMFGSLKRGPRGLNLGQGHPDLRSGKFVSDSA